MNARQKAKFYKKLYEKEKVTIPRMEHYCIDRLVKTKLPIQIQAEEVEIMVEDFMSKMKELVFQHIKYTNQHLFTHYWIDVWFKE